MEAAVQRMMRELGVSSPGEVRTGRDATGFGSADLRVAREESARLANHPTYFAATGDEGTMVVVDVTRDECEALVAAGARAEGT